MLNTFSNSNFEFVLLLSPYYFNRFWEPRAWTFRICKNIRGPKYIGVINRLHPQKTAISTNSHKSWNCQLRLYTSLAPSNCFFVCFDGGYQRFLAKRILWSSRPVFTIFWAKSSCFVEVGWLKAIPNLNYLDIKGPFIDFCLLFL